MLQSYKYFLNLSAPAINVPQYAQTIWHKVGREILSVIIVVGILVFGLIYNSRPYTLLKTNWEHVHFREDDFDTGDLIIILLQPNMFLNPGHMYMVVNSHRYKQKLLWDLTYWNSAQSFKNMTITLQELAKKKIPIFAIKLHHPSSHYRRQLTRNCMQRICKLTYNLRWNSNVLMEHLDNIMEELIFLPSLRNPFKDTTTYKEYCSLFILNMLVHFGVLHQRVLKHIPYLDSATQEVIFSGGSIFHPQLLLYPSFTLNIHAINDWYFESPKQIIMK